MCIGVGAAATTGLTTVRAVPSSNCFFFFVRCSIHFQGAFARSEMSAAFAHVEVSKIWRTFDFLM